MIMLISSVDSKCSQKKHYIPLYPILTEKAEYLQSSVGSAYMPIRMHCVQASENNCWILIKS